MGNAMQPLAAPSRRDPDQVQRVALRASHRDDRFAFECARWLAVDPDRHIADQRDPVELPVELRIEDVARREVRDEVLALCSKHTPYPSA